MITCAYCGVSYQTFRSLCDSCGAPLIVAKETAVSFPNLPPRIAQIRDVINIADLGNEASRQKAERLLKEIRSIWS